MAGVSLSIKDLEYDLANRLWKKCRVNYENDANGNRISRTLDSKTLNYIYDGENRLTQVTKNGVDLLDNVYDGAGMRIKEVKGGQTTYFVVQGNNPLMEYTPSDGKYKYFIYAGNKMVAEEMDGVVKYYYGDHLGSTRIVTDATGNKVAEYKFRPYGEKDSSSGTFSTEYQFTGKPSIDEVGLSYFGARFYDSEVGRFITQDPVKDGLNWYSYCFDNPLRYFDPDGRAATDSFWTTAWKATVATAEVVGGGLTAVGGAALMVGGAETVIGAVIGGVVAVHGANTFTSGCADFYALFTGNDKGFGTTNFLLDKIYKPALGAKVGSIVYTVVDIGASIKGTWGALRQVAGLSKTVINSTYVYGGDWVSGFVRQCARTIVNAPNISQKVVAGSVVVRDGIIFYLDAKGTWYELNKDENKQ